MTATQRGEITLATLDIHTAQEVYDHIVSHLRKQGCRSQSVIHGKTTCAYRGDDGTMCAAGACISDSEYSKDMEGVGYYNVAREARCLAHYDLISWLQDVHDGYSVEEWEMQFKNVATKFRLEYKENV